MNKEEQKEFFDQLDTLITKKINESQDTYHRGFLAVYEETNDRIAVIGEGILSIQNDVSELKTDVAELKTDVAELKSDMIEVKNNTKQLNTRLMRVEEVVL